MDRLALSLMVMTLLTTGIAELISRRGSIVALPVLILIGFASVLYWIFGEASENGDLRAYAVVQFLPFGVLARMLVLYKRPAGYAQYVLWAIALLAVAKVFEARDREVFDALGVVSGHTLKHAVAPLAGAVLVLMLHRRGGPPSSALAASMWCAAAVIVFLVASFLVRGVPWCPAA